MTHLELRWHNAGGRVVVAKLYAGAGSEYVEAIATIVAHPVVINALDRTLSEGAKASEHTYTSGQMTPAQQHDVDALDVESD